jgi:hypothetical protein
MEWEKTTMKIPKDLHKRFRANCRENNIPMSKVLTLLIKHYLDGDFKIEITTRKVDKV